MIPHSIILQYYSVTSKNIPSQGVRKENPPTSSFRVPFNFRFHVPNTLVFVMHYT